MRKVLKEKEIDIIINSIPSSRGKDFQAFHDSNLSLSSYISKKTGIPERRVAGVIANATKQWHKHNASMRQVIIELNRREPLPEGTSKSAWFSKIIGIPENRAKAFIANLSKTDFRLLAMDCTYETTEGMSEAKHLQQLFKIYDNPCCPSKLRVLNTQTPEDFFEALETATERQIHISAHGAHSREEGTAIYPRKYGKRLIKAEEVEGLPIWGGVSEKGPRLIVMAACNTGKYPDMAEAFYALGVDFLIAPPHSPTWIETALFNTLFYYNLFVLGRDEREAYQEAMKTVPDLRCEWNFFFHGNQEN